MMPSSNMSMQNSKSLGPDESGILALKQVRRHNPAGRRGTSPLEVSEQEVQRHLPKASPTFEKHKSDLGSSADGEENASVPAPPVTQAVEDSTAAAAAAAREDDAAVEKNASSGNGSNNDDASNDAGGAGGVGGDDDEGPARPAQGVEDSAAAAQATAREDDAGVEKNALPGNGSKDDALGAGIGGTAPFDHDSDDEYDRRAAVNVIRKVHQIDPLADPAFHKFLEPLPTNKKKKGSNKIAKAAMTMEEFESITLRGDDISARILCCCYNAILGHTLSCPHSIVALPRQCALFFEPCCGALAGLCFLINSRGNT